MSFNNRAYQRTVVFLDKRRISVPNNAETSRLTNARRVMDISFTKNNTAAEIGDILIRAFPPLAGKDLSGLEFIASYERGHAMKRVARGLQNGAQIMDLFGGSRKKKIFLFLPSSAATSTTTASLTTVTQASTSTSSSAPPPTLTLTSTSSSASPVTQSSTSLSLSTTPPTQPSMPASSSAPPARQSSTSTASSAPPPTQPPTSASSSAPPARQSSTYTIPVTQSSTSVTSAGPGSSVSVIPAELPSTSTPINLRSLPKGGASTRRYLTAMSSAGGLTYDDGSDSDSSHDDQNTTHVTILSDSEGDQTIALRGDQDQEPSLYGYVSDDFSTAGVVTDGNSSRTSEVLKCIEALEDEGQNAFLPFLTNTFEEYTWQGTEDSKVMVVVLLHFNCPLQSKRKLLSLLNNVVATKDCYLWIAEYKSRESGKVKVKYGLKNPPSSSVMVLAPCHSRNMPQCVEIFNESNLQGDRLDESIAKAQDLCNAVQDERKRLEEWRKVRNEEGLQFQSNKETSRSVPAQGSNWVAKSQSTTSSSTTTDTTMRSTTAMSSITTSSSTNITTSSTSTCPSVSTTPPTQTSESSIKDFRRNRVTSEPNGRGITIAIGLNDGKTITRTFEKNAFFQEVYDWVGSLDDVPLHFTLQRGKEVVRHTDALNQDELLELTERSPVEMRDLLETTVSFKGNYEYDRDENHSKTIEDEQKMHDEKGVEGREDEDNGDSDKGVEGREDEDNGDSDKGVEGREDDDNGDSDKGVEGREDDDNGDSDNDEKEEAIFENQKKRKRKDKRTTKDRRKKQKNVEKPN